MNVPWIGILFLNEGGRMIKIFVFSEFRRKKKEFIHSVIILKHLLISPSRACICSTGRKLFNNWWSSAKPNIGKLEGSTYFFNDLI